MWQISVTWLNWDTFCPYMSLPDQSGVTGGLDPYNGHARLVQSSFVCKHHGQHMDGKIWLSSFPCDLVTLCSLGINYHRSAYRCMRWQVPLMTRLFHCNKHQGWYYKRLTLRLMRRFGDSWSSYYVNYITISNVVISRICCKISRYSFYKQNKVPDVKIYEHWYLFKLGAMSCIYFKIIFNPAICGFDS